MPTRGVAAGRPTLVIVDSSILLNVLDIPGFNQDRVDVLEQFRLFVDAGHLFLLPIAAVFETGNHLADLADGRERRRHAQRFQRRILEALDGHAPWVPIEVPETARLRAWLDNFPDQAMRELGLGDVSIIDEWERACRRHPSQRVRIWTLHRQLQSYDRPPL